jgi:hypothetical protein
MFRLRNQIIGQYKKKLLTNNGGANNKRCMSQIDKKLPESADVVIIGNKILQNTNPKYFIKYSSQKFLILLLVR